jgi:site-specific DNA-methyltransferase (adenine-specific)
VIDSPAWRVARGDALALLRDLPDGSVDALVTDPPYSSGGMWKRDREGAGGVSRKYTRANEVHDGLADFEGDSRDQRGFLAWAAIWMGEAYRAAAEGSPCMVFTDWRQLPVMTDAVQAGGWVWRGIAVWDKLQGRPALGRFRSQTEFVIWGSKGKMAATDVCHPGVFPIPFVRTSRRHHPTEKSLRLMRQLVQLVRPGGVVLDPFAGAGTTGAAAILEGRRFVGFELSPRYCEVSRRYCEWAEGARASAAADAEVPDEVAGGGT